MSSSARHICRGFKQLSRNIPAKRKSIHHNCQFAARPFSSSITRRAEGSSGAPSSRASSSRTAGQNENVGEGLDETEYLTPKQAYSTADLTPSERADYELLSKEDQKQYLKLQNHFKAIFESSGEQEEIEALADQADKDIDREGGPGVNLDFPTARAKGPEIGYWAEDDDDEFGQMEDADNEFSEEHITTVAESELDLHRDIREYTRIAAWDLPLLQSKSSTPTPSIANPNASTRIRQTIPTTKSLHAPPIPLHNIYGRNPPSTTQSRSRILQQRPPPKSQPSF